MLIQKYLLFSLTHISSPKQILSEVIITEQKKQDSIVITADEHAENTVVHDTQDETVQQPVPQKHTVVPAKKAVTDTAKNITKPKPKKPEKNSNASSSSMSSSKHKADEKAAKVSVAKASQASKTSEEYTVEDHQSADDPQGGFLSDNDLGNSFTDTDTMNTLFADTRIKTDRMVHEPKADNIVNRSSATSLSYTPEHKQKQTYVAQILFDDNTSDTIENAQDSKTVSKVSADDKMEKKYPRENLILQFEIKDVGKGFDSPPRFSYYLKPGYPIWAQRQGVEGFVKIQLQLSATGTVKNVTKTESTIGPKLANYVKYVAKRWRFEPRYKHDKPAESTVEIKVIFRLYDEKIKNNK